MAGALAGSTISVQASASASELQTKQSTLLPLGRQSNACKSRLPWPLGSGDAAGITQGGATDG